jgi:hypothetical protein
VLVCFTRWMSGDIVKTVSQSAAVMVSESPQLSCFCEGTAFLIRARAVAVQMSPSSTLSGSVGGVVWARLSASSAASLPD